MNKNEFQFLAAIKNHQLIKIKKIDFTVSHKKNEIFCIISKNLTSLNTLWIMAPCSSQALVNSRFALMTWASASLIGLVHALTLLVRTCVSWRLFEATSAKEEQLWPLWLTSMHSLQTIWPQSSSNKRNRCLCSWQKTVTSDDSKETTLWSQLALLRVWKPAARLHMSSWQFKQKEVAGCSSLQASQVYKRSPSS